MRTYTFTADCLGFFGGIDNRAESLTRAATRFIAYHADEITTPTIWVTDLFDGPTVATMTRLSTGTWELRLKATPAARPTYIYPPTALQKAVYGPRA